MGKVALVTKQVPVPTHGTPVPLASSSLWVGNLTIKALGANTKSIFIAPVGTAPGSQGFELEPLAAYEFAATDLVDLATLQVDSQVNGEGVSLSYESQQA